MYPTETEPSLLEIELGLDREPASLWQRFANFLIDRIVFCVFLFFLGFIAALVDARQTAIYVEEIKGNFFLNYLVTCVVLMIFYTLVEGMCGGRTLGKLITRTRVVREDGAPFGWKDALLRSLCRVVPFEELSAFFGDGFWHDKWTKTKVVKIIN
ncbi:RDD family protein [Danxiaibacter flavus]|uniref:RDD family protein n=1 Tax=Danxiaibacter flavus TaxID=3049108 RepID=A0ABV3ZLC1_9BACT|nr:RDD family protein [Chitinophagaceae bacterium DXS]